jgi:hypothetical protein
MLLRFANGITGDGAGGVMLCAMCDALVTRTLRTVIVL